MVDVFSTTAKIFIENLNPKLLESLIHSIDVEKLAKLELKEETGAIAQSIKKIGFFHEAPGYANQGFHIFLAEGLDFKKQALEDTEDIQCKKYTVIQFENMVIKGEITDAPTISAFGLLKIKKVI